MNFKDINKSIEEFEKERSEKIKQFVDRLSQIRYVDATPKRLKVLAGRMQEIVLDLNKDEKSKEEGKKIQDELNQINVVLKQGENITIKDFNDELSKIISREMIDSLEVFPENLWDVSPFKEIGLVPIGLENKQIIFPRIKDVFHPVISKSILDVPKSGENKASNTFLRICRRWWVYIPALFFPMVNQFLIGAVTKTFASGFDAADSAVQEACLDPNNDYNWLFCWFAAETEEKEFYSYCIKTSIFAKHNNVGRSRKRFNRWKVWVRAWVPADWWEWEGVRSHHRGRLFSDSLPWGREFGG